MSKHASPGTSSRSRRRSGLDVLVGSSGDDQLFGGNGRDILTGGLGLGTLNGGADDDILIAGRTNSDTSITRLTDLRSEWTSLNSTVLESRIFVAG